MAPSILSEPLISLSGIGKRTVVLFENLGVRTIQDLLFCRPIRYEDKTKLIPIAKLAVGMSALICGKVQFVDIVPRGRKSMICRINDATGTIDLRFFHYTGRQFALLKEGTQLRCFGDVRFGYAGLEMAHPDYAVVAESQAAVVETQLTPVYSLTEGLNQGTVRAAIKRALTLCESHPQALQDWLPEALLAANHYPPLAEAIKAIHAPDPTIAVDTLINGSHPAVKRLAFEELLTHHLSLKLSKQYAKAWQAPSFPTNATILQAFVNALPFRLTAAQLSVIAEISADLAQPSPMLRLVQGDVGSGKTVVAAFAGLLVVSAGFQVAIMAPTELLAEQHFRNFNLWLQKFGLSTVLLTGQLRGNARKTVIDHIANGTAAIIIGTHALFQTDIGFHRLGLIVVDEQHRFGVQQRLALRAKGEHGTLRPHQLVMTATPIPRTLAMLHYADLDVSIIDQLPPGRKSVTTSVIPSERRDEVIARIKHWISKNKQAYWVCTLIEESEILQCEAAEKTAERLAATLPDVRIALLHGRIKPTDKDAIMQAFKKGDIDLLVATTVIEVGVDVPNANLMIIENPERLGLSQLHQLRGRVGRGSDESYCLLLYQSPLSGTARQRLGILRESNDGFYIAEQDLKLRGPGEVMGTRQTGQVAFKIADLVRDADMLDNIPTLADTLLQDSPDCVAPLIERWLGHRPNYSEV